MLDATFSRDGFQRRSSPHHATGPFGLAFGEAIGEPSVIHRLHAAVEHLESLMTTMGAHSGLRHARKHLAAYAEFAGATVKTAPLRLVDGKWEYDFDALEILFRGIACFDALAIY
jgi:hypothetical protein